MSEDLTTNLSIFLEEVLVGGPDNYVLTATGIGGPVDWEAGGGGGGGSGDVVGPSSSVDNTIARYDGATGKLLQGYTSGGPTISDLGILGVTVGAQFGATGQVDAIYDVTSETVTDLIDIRHEFATVTTDLAWGLGMFITFNPGSNVSGTVFGFNVEARTKAGNTKTFSYVDGGDTDVYIFGSGDVGEAVGGTHSAQIAQSDGTGGAKVSLAVGARAKITNHLTLGSGKQVLLARGVEAQINNENTSVMPQADAVWAQVVNEGGGRIASAAALRAVAPVLTNGSGTNFVYGLYIEDQTVAVDSGNYQIYSAGNLHSYFEGPIEEARSITIGKASTATGALLLKGTTSGTVTIQPADAAGTHAIKLPTADAAAANRSLTSDGSGQWGWSKITLTPPATSATLTIADGKTASISNTLTFTGTDSSSVAFGAGGTVVFTGVTALASLATVGTVTSGTWGSGAVIAGATMTLGSDATGDVYYRNSSGVLTRIAAGARGTLLAMGASSVPAWGGGAVRRISVLNGFTLPDTSGNVWYEPASVTQTNDRYPQGIWRFKDTATKDSLGIRFSVPADYFGAGKLYVFWTTTATSGNAIWALDYSSAAVTASVDPSADEESLTVTTAAPGSSQTGVSSSMTLTAADVAANDFFQGKVSRNGAGSDTIAADLVVYDVVFEYTIA